MLGAVILGRKGGPFSTSCAEALRIRRRSSPHSGCQVVRPRCPRCCRRLDPLAGEEHASNLLVDLGCKAWRSPASGDGAPEGLDCFCYSSSRVFLANLEALSSNVWFFRARDLKGLFVIYCTHHVSQYNSIGVFQTPLLFKKKNLNIII